jgi:hypothetical protein
VETFVPTTKWATIHALLALAARNRWKTHHMDVKMTFLNGNLKDNVCLHVSTKRFCCEGSRT